MEAGWNFWLNYSALGRSASTIIMNLEHKGDDNFNLYGQGDVAKSIVGKIISLR